MSINVYLDPRVKNHLGNVSGGNLLRTQRYLGDNFRKRVFSNKGETDFYFTLRTFEDHIPDFGWIRKWIIKVTCFEDIPLTPARATGRYVLGDAEAILEMNRNGRTYSLRLTSTTIKEAAALYTAIRGGKIAPVDNWEAKQIEVVPRNAAERANWLQRNHFVNITGLKVYNLYVVLEGETIEVSGKNKIYKITENFIMIIVDNQFWAAWKADQNIEIIKIMCPQGQRHITLPEPLCKPGGIIDGAGILQRLAGR